MPRKARSYKRHPVSPDPKYNNIKMGKFINYLMERGKKSTAQRIVYDALELIGQKLETEPRQVFEQAVKNISPILEVKARRIGGANYQVPIEVREPRKTALGMKWIVSAARSRKGMPMAERLAAEIVDAFNKTGVAWKKREDTHKMAEANRAFAHFARFMRKKR